MKKLSLMLVGLGLMISGASAATISCLDASLNGANVGTNAQLTGNDGCSLGGLTFSNFVVSPTPGATITLAQVNTMVVGNEVYLGFQIVTPPPPSDTFLMYKVTGTTLGVDLGHNGNLTTIQEVVCDTAFVAGSCPTGHVLVNFNDPPTANNVNQLYPNGGVGTVFILKDIGVQAGGSVSSFTNSHLTPVPEPMTLSIMGVGLLGLGLMRRRQAGKK